MLCTFHFLQAGWRWLYNSSNNINRDDHQHLMGHFQKLVRTPPSSSHCKNLITRGNNSDNYTESMINIFKSVVLQRMRAYNFIELFKFITEDLQMYFQRKLFALPFGKSLSWLPSVLVQQLLQSSFTLSNKLLLAVVNSPLHFQCHYHPNPCCKVEEMKSFTKLIAV